MAFLDRFRREPAALDFTPLADESSLDEALRLSEDTPVVLFKHSATCPTSTWARREMLQLKDVGDPKIFELVVQQSRTLSNHIAACFGIRHESPQAIVLYKASPVYHASHGHITADAIRAVLQTPSSA